MTTIVVVEHSFLLTARARSPGDGSRGPFSSWNTHVTSWTRDLNGLGDLVVSLYVVSLKRAPNVLSLGFLALFRHFGLLTWGIALFVRRLT